VVLEVVVQAVKIMAARQVVLVLAVLVTVAVHLLWDQT
jgi:hypothetical protein